MPNVLLTGVSGLIAHQRMLDVVGNNLANLNTIGYKVQRTVFSDLLYETIRPASSSSDGDSGGINPNQIGSGVKVAQVNNKFGQGNLELTGGDFDFALQGRGFFMVSDGTQNLYTRAGSFAVDRNGFLVDPANGYRVRRFGTIGEGLDGSPQFQESGDPFITIPIGAVVPGKTTTEIDLAGNLASTVNGIQATVLTTQSPFRANGAAATAATLLNELESNNTFYEAGDQILVTGSDSNGDAISEAFDVDDTTTLGDLVAFIDAEFPESTVALDSRGNITLTANEVGASSPELSLEDDGLNTGTSDFDDHSLRVTTEGSDGDTYDTGIVVWDQQGGAHNVNLEFRKITDNEWDLVATLEGGGTIIDGAVDQIVFDSEGMTPQVQGTGTGDMDLTFQFDGIPALQTVSINFAPTNSSLGVTQMALTTNVEFSGDGFGPGALSSISMGLDGVVSGVASNGTIVPIAQLAIATFRNRNGLNSVASNYFAQSLNSGEAQIGTALSGPRGGVLGGQLESSNVDIASEFTNLIVAQRGFSANARTITIADQVLEELTNIIR